MILSNKQIKNSDCEISLMLTRMLFMFVHQNWDDTHWALLPTLRQQAWHYVPLLVAFQPAPLQTQLCYAT